MTAQPPNDGADTGRGAPEPFEASALGASLTVTSLDTSLAWYRDVLGFTVSRTFERDGTLFAASLRAGAVALLLTQDNGAQGPDRIKGVGFSLQFTTSQSVDGLAARVRSHGVTLDTEPADIMGARAFRVRDPDGFKLVVSSPR